MIGKLVKPSLVLSASVLLLGMNACTQNSSSNPGSETAQTDNRGADPVREPWPMHHVNNNYLIANSLNPGDVNQDGYSDYAVIDESLGLQTIIFHPGANGNVRDEWPRVVLGKTGNPEYSCLGDLDGDGNLDLVVVEGDDLEKGLDTGVRIYWGPDKSRVTDPEAWVSAGHIPGTQGEQYLYAECHDVNGDGALDIVVGGRRHSVTKKYAGVQWLEAPINPADRKDIRKWKHHFIDPDALSGHGFVFTDIDQDGDMDIVLANADWDTSAWDRELYWYENPGSGSAAQKKPWKKHSVWRSAEFYAKPQVGIADVDGDGLEDICTQTQNSIHLFLKKSLNPVSWEHIVISKPDETQWIGRPVKMVDLNGDGKINIVGMLIHNDGNLPKDKASVFWMEYEGDKPTATNWKTNVIKWSDGYNSRHQWVGEKWDHCLFYDVDGDGDLDIVGNVEEHYHRNEGEARSFFSVVWFENPVKQPDTQVTARK
jgi:hypothetical protein